MKNLFNKVYTWLVYLPVFGILTAILATLCILVCLFSQRLGSRYVARTWARWCYKLSLSTIAMVGEEHINPRQSYVVIANHMSVVDIFVLYGFVHLDLKWVMKKELRKVPFLGWATAAMGHIFMDRGNRQKAFETLMAIKDTLPDETSILFFPEGTRSDKGVMKRFKRGAFTTARALELPILPITINDSEKIVPNKTIALNPGVTELIIHAPIPVEKVLSMGELELTEYAQSIVQSGRKA